MESLGLNFYFNLDQTIAFINIWEQSLKKNSIVGGVGLILNELLELRLSIVIYIIIEWQNLYFPALILPQ